MPFNTFTVTAAVAPTAVKTTVTHYLPSQRAAAASTPSSQLSYAAGLSLIRRFLVTASHHTVEDFQAFTAQRVPHPVWVRIEDIPIATEYLDASAEIIAKALEGGSIVGGTKWWRWRETDMKAEEIEMRSDKRKRETRNVGNGGEAEGEVDKGKVLLYVHGGAYYFGSVDTHRYQLQRYARKLGCRVVAPRYRLAPQFPFPCGLYDCLAVYLHLLAQQPASTIMLGGDSAGGGMVLALLTLMRDHRLPMPAGAILVSPWVDLCHSFPSVIGDNSHDYIPPHGFLHRPSPAWPPPNTQDLEALGEEKPLQGEKGAEGETKVKSAKGFDEKPTSNPDSAAKPTSNTTITLDDKTISITDQIQLYCPNPLLSHPLVSPIASPSLGSLPPLLILCGGGEVLRDEQIYIAHKAAFPAQYPTWSGHLSTEERRRVAKEYTTGTKVVLRVFEKTCHVAPIMAWTRPARAMYREASVFARWAWNEAGGVPGFFTATTPSSSSDDSASTSTAGPPYNFTPTEPLCTAAITHESLPAPWTPPASVLSTPASAIGVITSEPVRRWLEAKQTWDTRYATQKRAVQKRQLIEIAVQEVEEGETPPPTAMYGRRTRGVQEKRGVGWGLWVWAGWGAKRDKAHVPEEEKEEDRRELREEKKEERRMSRGRRGSTPAPAGVAVETNEKGI